LEGIEMRAGLFTKAERFIVGERGRESIHNRFLTVCSKGNEFIGKRKDWKLQRKFMTFNY